MTIVPPLTPACFPPSKERNNAILDSLAVERRPEWQPGFGGPGWTHCNQAAETALEFLGAHIPKGLLANAQQAWLGTLDGAMQGWECVPETAAFANAEGGIVTVATLHEEPHGHIAVVRGRDETGKVLIWQAGARNYNAAPIALGFGYKNLPHVKYFSCKP